MMAKDPHITPTNGSVSVRDREHVLGQRGAVIWLTGLSGSGKSTLSYALERRLTEMGRLAYALDGDNMRMGLCNDLGFDPKDRKENIRRIGEVAALFANAGLFVLVSAISPYRQDRSSARSAANGAFIEVYLDVTVETCERRDPKGLYKKVRTGEISNFTGISAPYEQPQEPEIRIDTEEHSIDVSVDTIVKYLQEAGHFAVFSIESNTAKGSLV